MDDKLRSSGTDNDVENPQKSRKRRTPSGEPVEKSSRRRSFSRSRSKSRSPSNERGRRRRSRSRSPGRYGRFRGGYQRDFRRNRRSPSRSPDRYRGRNARNARRSRSGSFDRFRNRRNSSKSRDRSMSPRRDQQQQPPYPTEYPTNPFAQPNFQNQQPYPNYDYQVSMIQPVANSYPPPFSAPPSPVIGGDFQPSWTQQAPPPPIISSGEPKTSEPDDEKQKREAAIALEKKNQRDTLCKQRDDYIRRANALKKELNVLREQRGELITDNEPPSPTTYGFLKENDRLQRIWSSDVNSATSINR